jgi:hypothetical protein
VYAFVFRFNGFYLRLSLKGKRANHNRIAWRVNSKPSSLQPLPTLKRCHSPQPVL